MGERAGSRSSRHNGFNCPEKRASTLRKFGTTDAVLMRNARERYFHHSTRDSAILTNAGEFVGWRTGTEHHDSSFPLSSKYQCGCACLGLRRPLQLTRSLRAAYARLTRALRTPYSKRPLPDRSVFVQASWICIVEGPGGPQNGRMPSKRISGNWGIGHTEQQVYRSTCARKPQYVQFGLLTTTRGFERSVRAPRCARLARGLEDDYPVPASRCVRSLPQRCRRSSGVVQTSQAPKRFPPKARSLGNLYSP